MGSFTIVMAYAMISSGYLPLMMHMLLLALSCELLVAKVSWADRRLRAENAREVAAPATKTARLFSVIMHLTAIAGDPRTFIVANLCLLSLSMGNSMHPRPATAWKREHGDSPHAWLFSCLLILPILPQGIPAILKVSYDGKVARENALSEGWFPAEVNFPSPLKWCLLPWNEEFDVDASLWFC